MPSPAVKAVVTVPLSRFGRGDLRPRIKVKGEGGM